MKDFFKSFGFKVLAAIALVLVGVMIYAASTGGMATIPSMISGAILTPLQSAASAVSDGLNSFAGMFGSSTELQKQIDELQAELTTTATNRWSWTPCGSRTNGLKNT